MSQRSDLKILLLQIRDDDITLAEEFDEFVHFSGLHPDQFTLLNAFENPAFDANIIEQYHALFVGGSSDASVLKLNEYPFIKHCKQMMQRCYDKDIPVFASCFGFQIAVEQFDGRVILDKENIEIGMLEINTTDAADNDVLFFDMPKIFWSVCGHKERAERLPQNAILLAWNELCPYHAFKLKDKPFYAFQFHPEMGRQDLIKRLIRYQERYLDNSAEVQSIIDSAIHDGTEASSLVAKFVDRIILQNSMSKENVL